MNGQDDDRWMEAYGGWGEDVMSEGMFAGYDEQYDEYSVYMAEQAERGVKPLEKCPYCVTSYLKETAEGGYHCDECTCTWKDADDLAQSRHIVAQVDEDLGGYDAQVGEGLARWIR